MHLTCLQDLTVTATTELGEHEINLLPDESEISTVNVQVIVNSILYSNQFEHVKPSFCKIHIDV